MPGKVVQQDGPGSDVVDGRRGLPWGPPARPERMHLALVRERQGIAKAGVFGPTQLMLCLADISTRMRKAPADTTPSDGTTLHSATSAVRRLGSRGRLVPPPQPPSAPTQRSRPEDRSGAYEEHRGNRPGYSYLLVGDARSGGTGLRSLLWSGTGPVAQPVFKTGPVWQPHACSVRLRGRSVRNLAAMRGFCTLLGRAL